VKGVSKPALKPSLPVGQSGGKQYPRRIDPMAKKRPKRFDELLEEIETIVEELERGELPLEESLDRYQRGIEALRRCYAILEETQRKIEMVLGEEGGKLVVGPFVVESPGDTESEKQEGDTPNEWETEP